MAESWKRWEGQVVNGALPLVRYLGGSDHSAVFLTERVGGSPQKAAIKLVSAGDYSEQQLARWKRAAKLAHPNLIRIFESGRCELEGTPLLYAVMEVAEEDLGQIIPERALTSDETRAMLPTVLRALGHIHGQGLVHGRIKPSNILAVGEQVKLSSDTLRGADDPTEARTVSPYDAPEVKTGKISPSSDVWSLGMTTGEILTQQRPQWDRSTDPGVKLPQGIPQPFEEIVRRCLVLDPQNRPTVAEIGELLQPERPAAKKPVVQAAVVNEAKQKSVAWPYLLAVIVIALLGWALMSRSKAPVPAPPADSVVPNKGKLAPATPSPVADQKPAGAEKPNPGTHANARSLEGGNASVKGAVLQRVMPRVAPSARETIEGKIRVRVRVKADPLGNVTEAWLESRGPSQYFARLALEAAREWKFTPPQAQGRAIPSEWRLQFGFRRTDTEVLPSQISP